MDTPKTGMAMLMARDRTIGEVIEELEGRNKRLERELTAEQEKVKRLREAMGNYLLALDQWENTNSAEKRVARMEASMRAILEATK